MTLTEYCTGIADAIREKEGSTEAIPATDHAARIRAIETGGGATPDTCTVTIGCNAASFYFVVMKYTPTEGYHYYIRKTSNEALSETIQDIVCNSLIVTTCRSADGVTVDGGVVRIPESELPYYFVNYDMVGISNLYVAPSTAGATGSITLKAD